MNDDNLSLVKAAEIFLPQVRPRTFIFYQLSSLSVFLPIAKYFSSITVSRIFNYTKLLSLKVKESEKMELEATKASSRER